MSPLIISPAEMLGALLATLGTLLLAVLFRRRLPVGVPEGVFIAALSGLLVANHALGRNVTGPARGLPLAIVLAGLAYLWFFAARWIERDPQPGLTADPSRALRRVLGEQAAVIAGLAAAVVLLSECRGGQGGWTAVVVALVLGVPAAFVRAGSRAWAPYLAAASGALALQCWATDAFRGAWMRPAAEVALYSGLCALLAALAAAGWRWRARRAIWLAAPEQAVGERPAGGTVAALVVALSGVSVLAGGFAGPVGLVPVGMAAAALGTLTAGHRRGSVAVGEFGLLLAGLAVVYGAGRWLPGRSVDETLGGTLAALWMLWLARFWQQQLHDGRPWTTAGRLIPSARRLAVVFAAVAAVLAGVGLNLGAVGEPWPVPVLAALALSGFGLLALQDAREHNSAAGCLAGLLGLTAAGVPLAELVRVGGAELPASVWLALVALIVALRTPVGPDMRLVADTRNAWVGGGLPVAAAYCLAWLPDDRQPLALGLTAAVFLTAWGLRRAGGRRLAARSAQVGGP